MYVGCSRQERKNLNERERFQYPRCTWVVVFRSRQCRLFFPFQYPRCTWVVVRYRYIMGFSWEKFQYPRCTWVVVFHMGTQVCFLVLFQYPRCTWVVVAESYRRCFSTTVVLVPTMHVGCSRIIPVIISGLKVGFSTHDARGLQLHPCKLTPQNCGVLVPTMHVGCSSEICTKAVSLCSYFITLCCICQVLFPINFRFFILFFCSICFYSDFLVRIPLFHPLNRRENQEFRGTIFYYYLLKCNYF